MLGLKRGTVKLVPYDPEWQKSFKEEAEELRVVFGGFALTIEHVGSTAFPAVIAKPILDMGLLFLLLKKGKSSKSNLKK